MRRAEQPLFPDALAGANEGLSGRANGFLLVKGNEWGLLCIGSLEGGKSSRGGTEGVMNILSPKDLFRPGSRIVECQTARGSFVVLVLPLNLPFGLGMKTRGQAD